MQNKTLTVGSLLFSFGVLFAIYGACFPVNLSVKTNTENMYADDELQTDNVEVSTVSIFGFKKKTTDAVILASDDNQTLTVYSHELKKQVPTNMIGVTKHEIDYDGVIYVGDTLDVSKFKIKSYYSDGTFRYISNFILSDTKVPMAKKYSIELQTPAGIADAVLCPVVPDSIEAVYKGAKVGDAFDKSKIQAKLHFPDGHTSKLTDFTVVDAPKVLTKDVTVTIKSNYGEGGCSIEPVKVKELTAVYTQPLYEGDVLQKENIQIQAVMDDGNSIPVTDFSFDNKTSVKIKTDVLIQTDYGEATLTVEPVGIKSVKINTDGLPYVGEDMNLVSADIVYQDDTKKMIDVQDMELQTDVASLPAGKQDVTFVSNGITYTGSLYVLQSSVSDEVHRTDLADSYQTYEIKNKSLEKLGLLCQRIWNDDRIGLASEASLMANRYELYHKNEDTDVVNTDTLLDFVMNDGHWGTQLQSYFEEEHVLSDVTKDVLLDVFVNGKRVLPVYVDERAMTSEIKSASQASYTEDTTELTLLKDGVNNTTCRFYDYGSSENQTIVFGYTEAAYQQVMQKAPKSVVNEIQVSDKDIDGIVIN